MKSSGIGGQAVLEGVMMRHKQDVAVAVRTPENKIEIGKNTFSSVTKKHKILGVPIIRGVVSFIESLVVGIKTLTFSASFYDVEEEEPRKGKASENDSGQMPANAESENANPEIRNADAETGKPTGEIANTNSETVNANAGSETSGADAEKPAEQENISVAVDAEETRKLSGQPKKEQNLDSGFTSPAEKAAIIGTVSFSVVIAIALFVLVPYVVSHFLLKNLTDSAALLALIEGIIKLVIFLGYLFAISRLEDIKRTFMYHGAEHKCINCIETGNDLVVDNVMKASKEHRRCGTSFIFIVLFISIIFFVFIRVDSFWLRLLIRLLLVPVIAGVAFEIIQWTGKSESKFAYAISRPGMWFQGLTTKEPTRDMVEVAICSVEAVFDWRKYLAEEFGKEFPAEEPDVDGAAEGSETYVAAEEKNMVPDVGDAVREAGADEAAVEKADETVVGDSAEESGADAFPEEMTEKPVVSDMTPETGQDAALEEKADEPAGDDAAQEA